MTDTEEKIINSRILIATPIIIGLFIISMFLIACFSPTPRGKFFLTAMMFSCLSSIVCTIPFASMTIKGRKGIKEARETQKETDKVYMSKKTIKRDNILIGISAFVTFLILVMACMFIVFAIQIDLFSAI